MEIRLLQTQPLRETIVDFQIAWLLGSVLLSVCCGKNDVLCWSHFLLDSSSSHWYFSLSYRFGPRASDIIGIRGRSSPKFCYQPQRDSYSFPCLITECGYPTSIQMQSTYNNSHIKHTHSCTQGYVIVAFIILTMSDNKFSNPSNQGLSNATECYLIGQLRINLYS